MSNADKRVRLDELIAFYRDELWTSSVSTIDIEDTLRFLREYRTILDD